ncbi:unnamed protein product [Ectocarpus fasciculatus]
MATMLSAAENLQGQPASPPAGASPTGSVEGTDMERVGSNGPERRLRQEQESGSSGECGSVAVAEEEEGTRVRPGMQRSRPLPRESPPTPPTSMYPTTAGAAAPGARPGSLRPSVSGLLAGNSSEIFSRQREDRADSLGDRYKGTNAFGRQQHQQHQQHAARTSMTRNAGYGAGGRYAERSGSRRPSHQHGAAGGAGSSSTAKSGMSDAGVSGSLQGGGGERAFGRDVRHGGGAGAGRRRDRRGVDRDREREAMAKEEGLGDDGEERRKQNGRVAQIADGLIWVQKHPVLAAVIWMCGKVLDPGSEDTPKDAAMADATAAEGQSAPGEEEDQGRRKGLGHQFSSCNSDGDSDAGAVDSMFPDIEGGLWKGSSGDFEKGRPVPPGFWRRHSKGRLSWSDDYQGGCLAEYYEDERSRMVSESSSVPTTGDTDVSTSAESAAAGAAAREEGGGAAGVRADDRCVVQPCHSQGGGSTIAAASPNLHAIKQSENGSEAPGLSKGQNVDGDVFHSALQLADEGHDLEGVGGCAALVQRDTFYGDVQEKMGDSSVHASAATGGSGGGAAPSSVGGESTKHEQSEGSECPGGQRGGGAAGDTRVGVGVGSGGGTGTPTAGTSPGTWSPQWGWYVTMTPPQDQYPAQQFPIPGAKPPTPTASSAAASDVATSGKGRPPRP